MKPVVLALFAAGVLAYTLMPARVEGEQDEKPPIPRRHVGVIPHAIADSSPVISASIQSVGDSQNTFIAGSVIKIHYSFQNRSDHAIRYSGASRDGSYLYEIVNMDVRDENGNLAEETEAGCDFHFFSPCHTTRPYPRGPVKRVLGPGEKVEADMPISGQYNLVPGIYTVVAYICGMSEGPECFKTNTIKITVSKPD